jgi:glucan endo-1,3-beta-D-glucosidase
MCLCEVKVNMIIHLFMMKCAILLALTTPLVSAADKIYTGFNYGAFWSEQRNVKRYADFHQGFELARNLTNTPVPFNSARLYTCITAGTKNSATEAFQAAIDTGTNLLLGMWISPGADDQPNDMQIDNELVALGKGFEQHGQKLADLVIGLSVGSEDVYRFNNAQVGLGSDNLLKTIKSVREKISASPFAKYMEGKPIGHTDTALYSVVPGSDFVGMNAYPYWEGQSIDNANATFMSILKDTQQRAGNTPVWISEIGWPISGKQIKDAVASAENYQRYWDEVGCSIFGKYSTFWFELLRDSTTDQPDWGLLDTKTHQPRIRDLSCGGRSNNWAASAAGDLPEASHTTLIKPNASTSSTVYLPGLTSGSAVPASSGRPVSLTAFSTQSIRTTHITQTRTTTVMPTSPSSPSDEEMFTLYFTTTTYVSPTLTPNSALPLGNGAVDVVYSGANVSVCIVMMDLLGDGIFIPVAIAPHSGLQSCEPPPRFTGSPFTMIVGPTVTSATLSAQRSSFDLYALSTAAPPLPATALASMTMAADANSSTCVTSAGKAYEAVFFNGKTFLDPSVPSCSSETTAASMPTITSSTTLILSSSPILSIPLTALSTSLISVQYSFSNPFAFLPSTFLTVTIPALAPQAASPPVVPKPTSPASSSSYSYSLAWSVFAPSSTPSSVLPASITILTTTPAPPTTASAPTTDPGCISVNGKWWEAAWDPRGEKRISGTGVECMSTFPPTGAATPSKFHAVAFFSGVLEQFNTTTWAAPASIPSAIAPLEDEVEEKVSKRGAGGVEAEEVGGKGKIRRVVWWRW